MAISRNNPANIRYNPLNNWVGQVGNDGGFVVFDSPHNGTRAQFKLLRTYISRGYDTLSEIIARYAPPSENDTSNYINYVSATTGINPDARLVFSDNVKMERIATAMQIMESGDSVDASVMSSAYRDASDSGYFNPTNMLPEVTITATDPKWGLYVVLSIVTIIFVYVLTRKTNG